MPKVFPASDSDSDDDERVVVAREAVVAGEQVDPAALYMFEYNGSTFNVRRNEIERVAAYLGDKFYHVQVRDTTNRTTNIACRSDVVSTDEIVRMLVAFKVRGETMHDGKAVFVPAFAGARSSIEIVHGCWCCGGCCVVC